MANQRFTRGARRKTHWTELRAVPADFTATGSTLIASTAVGHEGETLVRTRGYISGVLTVASAPGDGFFGAIGMAIVTVAAATIGITAIPTPLTEAGWDGWFVHRYFDCRAGLSGSNDQLVALDIDSKAMRKANEDEQIVMVLEVIESGTATLRLGAAVRMLSQIG